MQSVTSGSKRTLDLFLCCIGFRGEKDGRSLCLKATGMTNSSKKILFICSCGDEMIDMRFDHADTLTADIEIEQTICSIISIRDGRGGR